MNRPAKRALPRRARTVTGTAELVLEPRVRRFRTRLYVGAAFVVVLLALGALVAVRELAVIEPMLAAEGANAARAVVYELPAGAELHVPIEPRTDVLRFVVHAYGPSSMALTSHRATLHLEVRGAHASRTEELVAELPGLRSRVTAESSAMAVGDPLPVEVDVHDVGVGELVVKLSEVGSADGLLIRAYRREQLSEAEAALRGTALDRTKKDELARWTWELGWDELTPSERTAILQARWKRIGALRGASKDLRSMTVAVAPPASHDAPPARDELLGRIALRGDERIAVLLHPGAKVRYVSDEATVLRAVSRDARNEEQSASASGAVEVGPFDAVRSVELTAARDVVVEVRASNADAVEWLGFTQAWRVTATRAVVIDSPEADRVVRVSIRKPMARQESGLLHLAVRVELAGAALPSPVTQGFGADRARSRVDRYQDFDSREAPSERAQFFLALPRGSTARISATDAEPIDVSLAELDETAPPLPLPVRAPDAATAPIVAVREDAPSAFVARRPSNAHVFEASGRPIVRTARWFAPAPPARPGSTVALGHAKHVDPDREERGGRTFEGIRRAFDLEADARRPLYLPIVAAFDAPAQLLVRVEHDPTVRARPGLYNHWTLPRTMEVGPTETRATFVIGDDIPATGKLRLRLSSTARPPPSTHQRVLLPWASTRAAGPRWLGGAFEE